MSNIVHRKSGNKIENSAKVQSKSTDYDGLSKFKEKPIPVKPHKGFVRMIIIFAVLIIVYFTNRNKEKTSTLAGYREFVPLREHKIDCHEDSFSGSNVACVATFCKRFVTDNLISDHELSQLQEISNKIFNSDDESSKIYCLNSHGSVDAKSLHDTIKSIQPKIIENIAQRFEISHNSLYLARPTCFHKITNISNEDSELMLNPHYDKAVGNHIQYSVMIFLGRYKKDFDGGKLIFPDIENKKRKIIVVHSKPGRVAAYSSGSENTHYIENVVNGQMIFITLSFTCNQEEVLLLK